MAVEDVYIAGIAMTVFGRHRSRSLVDLAGEALAGALNDAGCRACDLGAAFWSGMTNGVLQGQHAIPGQVVLTQLGVHGIPIVNVENACASGSTAVHMAVQSLRSGAADVVLVIGAEKMNIGDRDRTMAVFEAGWDVERVADNERELARLSRGVTVPDLPTTGRSHSRFMDVYGAIARWHMGAYGTTQRDFAAVSVKNHAHAVHNPWAQHRRAWSLEEVLAAAPVVYPLTLPMCAPVSDGAAAAVMCTSAGLARIGARKDRAVKVAASVLRTASPRGPEDVESHVSTLAGAAAYEQAGVGPDDIDVAEVHDASAVGEIIQVENLGLAPRGGAAHALDQGELQLGGRLPVNTSGGLQSKGHPLGATGIGQLHELVTQLRGEAGVRQVKNARLALQENGGGFSGIEEAVVAVHILSL